MGLPTNTSDGWSVGKTIYAIVDATVGAAKSLQFSISGGGGAGLDDYEYFSSNSCGGTNGVLAIARKFVTMTKEDCKGDTELEFSLAKAQR